MKYVSIIIILVLAVACHRKPKVEVTLENDNMFYSDKVDKLPKHLQGNFADWVTIGTECYGIIAVIDNETKNATAFPIRCKVISYHKNGVKCRTIESVLPYKDFGCDKMGVKKGDTWLEEDGELFKTLEESIQYIKQNYNQ